MDDQTMPISSNISSVNSPPLVQSPIPQQTKASLLLPVLVTLFVSAALFGVGGYHLGKQFNTGTQQDENKQVLPTINPQANTQSPSIATDKTSEWKTFSDPAWNLTFKYPPEVVVEKKRNAKAETGVPQDYIDIGPLLTIMDYYDRTQTSFYTQNEGLLQHTQNDMQPVTIEGQNFSLTKVNWEDGVPSPDVPNCDLGTAQPTYFADIPNKLSLTFAFQILKTCDPVKGQIVQKGLSGNVVPDFDKQLQTAYDILSTMRFTK